MTLVPGQTIGGCTIEAPIASGGMGTVFRARKDLLEKTVAVKVLHPTFAPRDDHRSRFLREAKVAANLDHPGIVKVYDVGQDGEQYYMVMEYVEGKDLKTFVAEHGPFSARKALRIAKQVVDALTYAHDRGLIHRDIKPGNLLLSARGEAKLADFGLARLAEGDHQVTATGQILGTPVYMSPEQCRGAPLDGRSDLYSLGATLYYLLSGRVPFSADSTATLIHRVINDPPVPLGSVVPDLPEDVAALVQRLMAKHPGARYQDGRELAQAIQELLLERFVITINGSRKKASRARGIPWRALALGAAACAAVAAGVYLLAGPEEDPKARPDRTAYARELPRRPRNPIPYRPRPLRSVIHHRSEEPEPAAQPPNFQEEFEALQARVADLLEDLSGGDIARIMSYASPSERESSLITDAFQSAVDSVFSLGMESVEHRTSQRLAGRAHSTLTFSRRDRAHSMTLELEWVRWDGTWYVTSASGPSVD